MGSVFSFGRQLQIRKKDASFFHWSGTSILDATGLREQKGEKAVPELLWSDLEQVHRFLGRIQVFLQPGDENC